jgi:hypothetical protein
VVAWFDEPSAIVAVFLASDDAGFMTGSEWWSTVA